MSVIFVDFYLCRCDQRWRDTTTAMASLDVDEGTTGSYEGDTDFTMPEDGRHTTNDVHVRLQAENDFDWEAYM